MTNLGRVNNITKLAGVGLGLGLMSMTMAGCSSDKAEEEEFKREIPSEIEVIDWLVNEESLQMLTTQSQFESKVIEYEEKYPELKDQVSKKSKKYDNGTVINFRSKYFEVSYIVDNNGNIVGVTGKHVPISDGKIEIDELEEMEKKKLEELEKDGYGAELEKEDEIKEESKEGLVLPGEEDGADEQEEVEEVQEDEGDAGTTPDKPEVNTGTKEEPAPEPEGQGDPEVEEGSEEGEDTGGSLFGLDKLEKNKDEDEEKVDTAKGKEELIKERIEEETTSYNHYLQYVSFGVTLPINVTESEFIEHIKDMTDKEIDKKLKQSKKERIFQIENIGKTFSNKLFHNYIQDFDGIQIGIGNEIKNDNNLRVTLMSILDVTDKIDELIEGEKEQKEEDKKSKKDK